MLPQSMDSQGGFFGQQRTESIISGTGRQNSVFFGDARTSSLYGAPKELIEGAPPNNGQPSPIDEQAELLDAVVDPNELAQIVTDAANSGARSRSLAFESIYSAPTK